MDEELGIVNECRMTKEKRCEDASHSKSLKMHWGRLSPFREALGVRACPACGRPGRGEGYLKLIRKAGTLVPESETLFLFSSVPDLIFRLVRLCRESPTWES